MGQNWLQKIRLDWQGIRQLQQIPDLHKTLQKYDDAFDDGLGEIKGMINVDPQAQPRFCKARPVPFALRDKVEAKLKMLQRAGIIEPVQSAEWAAPIVPVVKEDGSVRICDDYHMTVNHCLQSYSGRNIDTLDNSMGLTSHVVLDLLHGLESKGFEVYTNKYYTSPEL